MKTDSRARLTAAAIVRRPLLALLCFAALATAHAPAKAEDVLLTMNSYGPIRIGMPVADVHRLLAKLGRKPLPNLADTPKAGCGYYLASPQLRFMTEDGKIVRIETQEPGVVTPSGIKVGASLSKVRHALGSRIEEMQQHYSDDPKDRSIVLKSVDRTLAIRIEGNDVVTEIFAGAAHAIGYVEGCS